MKVASDKCHKWVFKEPTECEPNISNYWQSSFDAVCIVRINPEKSTLFCLFSSLNYNMLNIVAKLMRPVMPVYHARMEK